MLTLLPSSAARGRPQGMSRGPDLSPSPSPSPAGDSQMEDLACRGSSAAATWRWGRSLSASDAPRQRMASSEGAGESSAAPGAAGDHPHASGAVLVQGEEGRGERQGLERKPENVGGAGHVAARADEDGRQETAREVDRCSAAGETAAGLRSIPICLSSGDASGCGSAVPCPRAGAESGAADVSLVSPMEALRMEELLGPHSGPQALGSQLSPGDWRRARMDAFSQRARSDNGRPWSGNPTVHPGTAAAAFPAAPFDIGPLSAGAATVRGGRVRQAGCTHGVPRWASPSRLIMDLRGSSPVSPAFDPENDVQIMFFSDSRGAGASSAAGEASTSAARSVEAGGSAQEREGAPWPLWQRRSMGRTPVVVHPAGGSWSAVGVLPTPPPAIGLEALPMAQRPRAVEVAGAAHQSRPEDVRGSWPFDSAVRSALKAPADGRGAKEERSRSSDRAVRKPPRSPVGAHTLFPKSSSEKEKSIRWGLGTGGPHRRGDSGDLLCMFQPHAPVMLCPCGLVASECLVCDFPEEAAFAGDTATTMWQEQQQHHHDTAPWRQSPSYSSQTYGSQTSLVSGRRHSPAAHPMFSPRQPLVDGLPLAFSPSVSDYLSPVGTPHAFPPPGVSVNDCGSAPSIETVDNSKARAGDKAENDVPGVPLRSVSQNSGARSIRSGSVSAVEREREREMAVYAHGQSPSMHSASLNSRTLPKSRSYSSSQHSRRWTVDGSHLASDGLQRKVPETIAKGSDVFSWAARQRMKRDEGGL